ncbi:MAG: beta-ketoacyl synthase N-terminal-like domain-containing protein, partial [Gemmataceae bacterium]
MGTADSATPLAIIGIGCLFPGADNLGAYWARIRNGVDAISDVPPTHWRPEDYYHPDPKAPDRIYTTRGGFLHATPFNPAAFGIAPNSLEATDTSQLLGLVVAQQALADAGYSEERSFDRSRVSVILGVTGTLELVIPLGARLGHPIWRRALREAGVAENVAEDVVRRIGDSYVGWQENSFPGLLGNVVAGRIANRFDLGGTNCVVDAACASSLSALHLACLELTTGRADMVLSGGVDTFNDIFMYTCFSKTPALSPTGDARPFDAAADGTILGEGLGMVVLKRLDDARRDGDRVYAMLRGLGSSSDGRGNAIYAPRASGQVDAIRTANRVAAVTPDTIEMVEAHGTGTRVGDATEVAALTTVYGEAEREGPWCAIGSVKSQIGHTKAAAGVAGLIKAVAALHHKVLPPTIKVTQPLEALQSGDGPFYINTQARPWMPSPRHPRRAAVSAFGFGGSNFHCVLEEASPHKETIDWDGDTQILAFTAQTPDEIEQQLSQWPAELEWPEFRARAAQTRQAWDETAECRLLLVVQRERTDVPRLLERARSSFSREPQGSANALP